MQVKKTLRQVAASLGLDVGCIDNSCMWGPPGGMGTNGGCRCMDRDDSHVLWRREILKALRVAQHLLNGYGEGDDD